VGEKQGLRDMESQELRRGVGLGSEQQRACAAGGDPSHLGVQLSLRQEARTRGVFGRQGSEKVSQGGKEATKGAACRGRESGRLWGISDSE
jgi:hypothetical protein